MAMKLSGENRQAIRWTGGLAVLRLVAAPVFADAAR